MAYSEKEIQFLKAQKDMGVSQETAFAKLRQLQQSNAGTPQSNTIPQQPQFYVNDAQALQQAKQAYQDNPMLGNPVDLAIGAGRSIGETAMGGARLFNQGASFLTAPLRGTMAGVYEGITGNKVQPISQYDQNLAQNMKTAQDYVATPSNITQSIGKGITDLAQYILPQTATSKIAKGSALAELGLGALADTAIGATKEGSTENLGSNFLQNLAIGAVMPAAQRILKGGSKMAYSSIPDFTKKELSEFVEKNPNFKSDIGELMYNANIPTFASPQKIAETLKPEKKDVYSIIKNLVQKADEAGQYTSMQDLAEQALRESQPHKMNKVGGTLLDKSEMMSGVKEANKFYSDLGRVSDMLSGQAKPEMQALIQAGANIKGKSNNLFLQKLKETLNAGFADPSTLTKGKKVYEENLRDLLKTQIEENVGKVVGESGKTALIEANKKYGVLSPLVKKLQKQARPSPFLTDVVTGSAAVGDSILKGNIGDATKSAMTAIGLKRVLTSPKTKSAVAKTLKTAAQNIPIIKALSAMYANTPNR